MRRASDSQRLTGRSRFCGVFAGAMLASLMASTAVRSADAEFGRYLSSECMTCHGVAKSKDTIPEIIGMAESTFSEVLKAYRDKRLPNEVMQTVASRLKDDEIAALAAYFSTAKRPATTTQQPRGRK